MNSLKSDGFYMGFKSRLIDKITLIYGRTSRNFLIDQFNAGFGSVFEPRNWFDIDDELEKHYADA